jgi:hypothetical protein
MRTAIYIMAAYMTCLIEKHWGITEMTQCPTGILVVILVLVFAQDIKEIFA